MAAAALQSMAAPPAHLSFGPLPLLLLCHHMAFFPFEQIKLIPDPGPLHLPFLLSGMPIAAVFAAIKVLYHLDLKSGVNSSGTYHFLTTQQKIILHIREVKEGWICNVCLSLSFSLFLPPGNYGASMRSSLSHSNGTIRNYPQW